MFRGTDHTALTESAVTPIVEDAPVKAVVIVKPSPQILTFSLKAADGLFGFNSIKLSNDVIEKLTQAASMLNTHPPAHAIVVAHTDSTGIEL
ncbi:MAG: hypothetical protein ACTH4J_18830 [Vibrio toranzoniae]|uniref:hypothetical protein n=1 Tax=Vibrio toranzoniae TaxID=1194427 RepID=UPI003F9536C9